jgi:hypothetical protein
MRTRVLELTALALLVPAVGLARGQTSAGPKEGKPAPAKSGLEEALAEALKNNPDLRAAAAKVALAEAELHRLRLQVVQKVVNAHRAVEVAKSAVKSAQADYDRARTLQGRGAISREEFGSAEQAMLKAKANLAAAESELAYLLGKPAGGGAGEKRAAGLSERRQELIRHLDRLIEARSVKGPVADKLRKALDKPVSVKFSETSVADALKELGKGIAGVHVQMTVYPANKVTANFTDVPLGAVLQFLEDAAPDMRIAVRAYGLLVAREVPTGAVPLDDFWKGGVREEADGAKGPPAGVEGEVKKVEGGLVQISVGSDAGLAKGHTLEVFRLRPAPKYLGQVRIVEVKPTEAVGKVVGRPLGEIQKGDRVASRIKGR